MDDSQIALVQKSFAEVAPRAGEAAEMFYARLFEIAPEVHPLFNGDMTDQGTKLMTTLGVVVNGLRDLDRIVPVAQELARQHVGYGVQPEHYRPVGDALLPTPETALGESFDAETQAAWQTAYATLSAVMIDAAHDGTDGA